jgi:hypothetical protein
LNIIPHIFSTAAYNQVIRKEHHNASAQRKHS